MGSSLCRTDHLLEFLGEIKHREIDTDLLILNGDVFDSHDFRRLKKSHWKVLSVIRKISKHVRVVWVVGNHDGPADVLSSLLGTEVVEEFEMISDNKKILVTHGDKFDEIMSRHPKLSKMADLFYRFISEWFPKKVSRTIKKSSKTYSRAVDTVKTEAINEAQKRGFDAVCVGHVHIPAAEDTGYYNSGSWTEDTCTYLSVKNGKISLNYRYVV